MFEATLSRGRAPRSGFPRADAFAGTPSRGRAPSSGFPRADAFDAKLSRRATSEFAEPRRLPRGLGTCGRVRARVPRTVGRIPAQCTCTASLKPPDRVVVPRVGRPFVLVPVTVFNN